MLPCNGCVAFQLPQYRVLVVVGLPVVQLGAVFLAQILSMAWILDLTDSLSAYFHILNSGSLTSGLDRPEKIK
jgi:hypothetical protein